jgi:hypothetical protein
VSSPPGCPADGGRSTLITSAPKSASVCVHQGPASTRERSRTRRPSRAPRLLAGGKGPGGWVGLTAAIVRQGRDNAPMYCRQASALCVTALMCACAPALDWREVRPPHSGLVALFPCKPNTLTRSVALAGQTVQLALHACRAGGQTWGLAVADVGDPARVTTSLEGLRRSAAVNLGAGSATTLPLNVAGATPNPASTREQLAGRLPDGQAVFEQLAVFARGTVVYQATVLGSSVPAEAADTFFAALRAA